MKKSFLTLVLSLVSGICWGDLTFEFQTEVDFTKTTMTTDNLDHRCFEGTNYTGAWTDNKNFTTYVLNGQVIWVPTDTQFYGLVSGSYGWIGTGRVDNYPLQWYSRGHTEELQGEVGYIMNVCDRFKFIPHVGFDYNVVRTHLSHQREAHKNPTSFVSQNGNKSKTTFYSPYLGFEVDFTSRFFDCTDIQFQLSYDLGYIYGQGKDTVHHFLATDQVASSRYGRHIKYRDLISHDFQVGAAYALCEKWLVGLTLEYEMIYNTHNLSTKLERNQALVKAGQFTKSQYHEISDYFSQNYAITLSLIYNFSGKGGTWIR